jgi:hypothetical protein
MKINKPIVREYEIKYGWAHARIRTTEGKELWRKRNGEGIGLDSHSHCYGNMTEFIESTRRQIYDGRHRTGIVDGSL